MIIKNNQLMTYENTKYKQRMIVNNNKIINYNKIWWTINKNNSDRFIMKSKEFLMIIKNYDN